ncbi:MAG: capsular biosynthesis protein [Pseudomonadota bacterium]
MRDTVGIVLNKRALGHTARPLHGRRFLMLQGPFGPFYKLLADRLQALGADVIKINLNGCDLHGWGVLRRSVLYRGTLEDWSTWLSAMVRTEGITDLLMHSDCQKYHHAAAKVARSHELQVHVTEQGYLRPHWVTFEQGGVNANSSMYAALDEVRRFPTHIAARRHDVEATSKPTQAYVLRTIRANAMLYLAAPLFPGYKNAFSYPVLKQAGGHIRRALRNRFGHTNRRSLNAVKTMVSDGSTPYFVALLQCPGDSQIYKHSPFADLGEFCERVIDSFAKNAPENAVLVFKRHPLDHDLDDHRSRINEAAQKAGILDRLLYIDGGVLGQIIPRAAGVMTINSTAGLASVDMGCPTICLGQALYDTDGLTHQGELDGFWRAPTRPNRDLVERFMGYLLTKTQVNGDYATERGMELALAGITERLVSGCKTSQVLVFEGHRQHERRLMQPSDDALTALPVSVSVSVSV